MFEVRILLHSMEKRYLMMLLRCKTLIGVISMLLVEFDSFPDLFVKFDMERISSRPITVLIKPIWLLRVKLIKESSLPIELLGSSILSSYFWLFIKVL